MLNPLAVTVVPTTITATSGTRTGTATLTVIAPQLSSIAFSTTILDLTVGTSSPLAVTATFSDGTTQDVTTISAWTPGNPAIASVAAGGLGTERVTGIAAGIHHHQRHVWRKNSTDSSHCYGQTANPAEFDDLACYFYRGCR